MNIKFKLISIISVCVILIGCTKENELTISPTKAFLPNTMVVTTYAIADTDMLSYDINYKFENLQPGEQGGYFLLWMSSDSTSILTTFVLTSDSIYEHYSPYDVQYHNQILPYDPLIIEEDPVLCVNPSIHTSNKNKFDKWLNKQIKKGNKVSSYKDDNGVWHGTVVKEDGNCGW